MFIYILVFIMTLSVAEVRPIQRQFVRQLLNNQRQVMWKEDVVVCYFAGHLSQDSRFYASAIRDNNDVRPWNKGPGCIHDYCRSSMPWQLLLFCRAVCNLRGHATVPSIMLAR